MQGVGGRAFGNQRENQNLYKSMEPDAFDKLHGLGPRLSAAIAAARTTARQLARRGA